MTRSTDLQAQDRAYGHWLPTCQLQFIRIPKFDRLLRSGMPTGRLEGSYPMDLPSPTPGGAILLLHALT